MPRELSLSFPLVLLILQFAVATPVLQVRKPLPIFDAESHIDDVLDFIDTFDRSAASHRDLACIDAFAGIGNIGALGDDTASLPRGSSSYRIHAMRS